MNSYNWDGTFYRLSSLLGYRPTSYLDAVRELKRNQITERDIDFFLPLSEAESYRREKEAIRSMGWYAPSSCQISKEKHDEIVLRKKITFLANAAQDLYANDVQDRFDFVAANVPGLERRPPLDDSSVLQYVQPEIVRASQYKWVSPVRSSMEENVAKLVKEDFQTRIPEDIKSRLSYKYTFWDWSVPLVQFKNVGVDAIELGGNAHALVDIKIFIRQYDERVNFIPGCVGNITWNETSLGRYLMRFGPLQFPRDLIPVQTLPLVLIRGLAEGRQEPEGCVIIARSSGSTSYAVNGCSASIHVDDGLRERVVSRKDKGGWTSLLSHFAGIGAMDQVTFEVIKNKSVPIASSAPSISDARIEAKANAIAELTKEDAEKLRIAISAKKALSGDDWARLLGFKSRQGAFAFLERMQAGEFLVIQKSLEGTSVTRTTKAEQYLRSLRGGSSGRSQSS